MKKLLVSLALLASSFTAQAAVFFDDNFETSLEANGWVEYENGCANVVDNAITRSFACLIGAGSSQFHNNPARVNSGTAFQPFGTAISGTHVLENNFDGPNRPDGGDNNNKGYRISRPHTAVGSGGHYWLRFWMRLSTNFVGNFFKDDGTPSNGFSKTIYINTASGGLSPVVEVLKDRRIMMAWQGGGTPWPFSSTNLFSNTGFNPSLNKDQWYCLEFHIGMASGPNVANGVYEAWIDGVKHSSYTGVPTHKNTVPINHTDVYVQAAESGSKFIDNLGVGNTRLGCGSAPPPVSAPPPPVNLQVQ